MEFRILGPLEVVSGERRLDLGGARQRALLALLLIEANRVVSTDRLVDELWPAPPPARAPAILQDHIYHLRRSLEPGRAPGAPATVVVTQAPGYVLRVEPHQLDARRFEALAEEGRAALASGRADQASQRFDEALSLWRGPALAGVAHEPFAAAEAARLDELRLAVIEQAIDAALALGRHGAVVAELENLVSAHPLRERFRAQLMVALYRAGRQAEALRAYQAGRAMLGEELGIEPSRGLQELERAILLQDPALGWQPPQGTGRAITPGGAGDGSQVGHNLPVPLTSFVGPGSGKTPGCAHNLPTLLTSFVGREQAVSEVAKLVDQARLITLIGPGGMGKTRLALAVAERLASSQADGTWLVDLSPLTEDSLLPQALGGVLGVREEPGRRLLDTVIDHLRDRQLLIVLDNCEHLVVASARLMQAVLTACPAVRVLATSREPLGMAGEVCWRVPPLNVPDPSRGEGLAALADHESVRLFLDRAWAARPDLEMGDADASAVAQVCASLEGIPLALELAAARVSVLTVAEIAARVDDRLGLLTRGSRTSADRHRTLDAALDWSHELLSALERIVFRRLAVFSGGFSLDAAEAVAAGDQIDQARVLDLVDSLVAKSLVLMDAEPEGARYRMLETIRQYARRRLDDAGEGDEVAAAHRRFYMSMAEAAEPQALRGDCGPVLDRLEANRDNFRAALRWSLQRPEVDEEALRLAHVLYPLWYLRGGLDECRRWMEELLSRPTEACSMASAVARRAGVIALDMGDVEGAARLSDHALALARRGGDRRHLGRALKSAGVLASTLGDLEAAREMLEESHSIAREVGDHDFVVETLIQLAWVAQRRGRFAEARGWTRRFRGEEGDESSTWDECQSLLLLAWVDREQGRYDDARERLARCGALASSEGAEGFEAEVLAERGSLAAAEGRRAEAVAAYEAALDLARRLGRVFPITSALGGLGELASVAGQHSRARARLEQALESARASGDVLWIACSLNRLGAALARAGNPADARTVYQEALAMAHRADMPVHLVVSLEGLARLEAAWGRDDTAARLWGHAETVRASLGAPLAPSERDDSASFLQRLETGLGEEALAMARAAGRTLSTDEAVRLAFPG